jgi:chromosome segregation ATPase
MTDIFIYYFLINIYKTSLSIKMSELAYSQSNKKEFYNVNVRNLSREDIRHLHEEMFKRQNYQTYQIKRENLVVFCALACRSALNLNPNIFVRFIDTEIVSFLEEIGIINLVSKSNFSKLGDIFTVLDPYSKSDSRIRNSEDQQIIVQEQFETGDSKRRKFSEYSSSTKIYDSRIDESFWKDKINSLEKECNRLFGLFQEKVDESLCKELNINRLLSQLESKSKENNSVLSFSKQLKDEISDLNTAIDYITEEKKRADAEIMRLCSLISQTSPKGESSNQFQRTPGGLAPKVETLEHVACERLQMKITKLERMNSSHLCTINELTKQLDSMHQLYSSTSSQLTTLQKKSTEFINRADQKEEENARLLAEITLLKEDNAFLLKKYKGEDSTPTKRKFSDGEESNNK